MSLSGIHFDPVPNWPTWWVITTVVLVFFATTAWHNARRLSRARAALLSLLRLLGIIGLLLLLLRPSRQEEVIIPSKQQLVIAAIDVSQSMEQPDAARSTRRLDAALNLLQTAKLENDATTLRWFAFSDDARPITPDQLEALRPDGDTTHFHTSITTLLASLAPGQQAEALLLFTDGHDFEMVSPTKTAMAARARETPVYAIPIGSHGQVRDVSLRMTHYQPYSYVRQKSRISAMARFTGCENELVNIQLLRNGTVIDTLQLSTRDEAELPIEFTVTEPEAGQFEYEIRAQPIYKETTITNNSAITYLNVLDDKLRVLLLEGSPYWDTTFLLRSLTRNDKMEVDAVIQIAPGKARRIRSGNDEAETKTNTPTEWALPSTREDFEAYDAVLLGANTAALLNETQQAALVDYVREGGGVLVCTRGPSGLSPASAAILDPVEWESAPARSGEIRVQREGRGTAPMDLLASFQSDARSLPPLTSTWRARESRSLTATLATTQIPADSADPAAAFLHRPVGRGQVLALGVGDFWHWAFKNDASVRDAVFDRLWDQTLVWLMAGSDRVPGSKHQLRTSTANLPLGQEIHLRLQLKQDSAATTPPVLNIEVTDGTTAQLSMTPSAQAQLFEASYLPPTTGRHSVTTTLPDGSRLSARFMVHQEDRERTEVATDRTYLNKLCVASGGSLLEPADLPAFLERLQANLQPNEKRFRHLPLWDRPWILALLVSCFGLDWYLRRRWGLT